MTTTTPPVKALLADGEIAWVRRLDSGDITELQALRARLSGRDRYLRFFELGVMAPAGSRHIGHCAARYRRSVIGCRSSQERGLGTSALSSSAYRAPVSGEPDRSAQLRFLAGECG
jgi:hypothetical protein